MAWKVYGATAGNGYSRDAGGEVYGPLPLKRWVRDIPNKRHKVKHRVTNGLAPVDAADSYNERRAKDYARWLARRDGIKIEGRVCRVAWSGFYGSKMRNTTTWRGESTKVPVYQRRIQAVEWGRDEEVYNTLKTGKRGAFLYKRFIAETTISIPNWDWEPAEPVEETLEAQAA